MKALNDARENPHYFPLLWLLVVSVTVFGVYVAWDLGLLATIILIDQSYMASFIITLVVSMSVHCGWNVIVLSMHIQSARCWIKDRPSPDNINSFLLRNYINDLSEKHVENVEDHNAVFEVTTEKIRSSADLGWFSVDFAVRLGLLGTIIGFILIFASLDTIDVTGGDDLKNLLLAMSGGMGTALLTTLTGLIGASLLSFQYLILGRECECLVELLLKIRRQTRTRH